MVLKNNHLHVVPFAWVITYTLKYFFFFFRSKNNDKHVLSFIKKKKVWESPGNLPQLYIFLKNMPQKYLSL